MVDHWGNDMAGRLIVELDDILAQVALNCSDSRFGQGMIEMNLFSDHRFSLDHLFDIGAPGQVEDDLVGLFAAARPVDLRPIFDQARF